MKRFILALLITPLCLSVFAKNDSTYTSATEYPKQIDLQIKYVDRYPFFYNEGSELVGIEKEIIDAFITWSSVKKGINITPKYRAYTDFEHFFEASKNAKTPFIGSGSVTMEQSRKAWFDFSGPYLNNISVLVSTGAVSNLSNIEKLNSFSAITGYTTKNSVHENYLQELIANGAPIKISYIKEQLDLPVQLQQDTMAIGYMDLLNFWSFHKENPSTYIKIHRVANKANESFAFITQKNAVVTRLLNEFFDSGFGFTATKKYKSILEKYLSEEVIEAVEVNKL